jgi:hypothetical protein
MAGPAAAASGILHESAMTAADMDALYELNKAEDALLRYHDLLKSVMVR